MILMRISWRRPFISILLSAVLVLAARPGVSGVIVRRRLGWPPVRLMLRGIRMRSMMLIGLLIRSRSISRYRVCTNENGGEGRIWTFF